MRDLNEALVCVVVNPGQGYTSSPSEKWPARPDDADHDREWPNTDCPRLKTLWRPASGEGWIEPIGWQGSYVNLNTYDGLRIWTYDEFWGWVKTKNAQRWDR